jgi:hypothetical protein
LFVSTLWRKTFLIENPFLTINDFLVFGYHQRFGWHWHFLLVEVAPGRVGASRRGVGV